SSATISHSTQSCGRNLRYKGWVFFSPRSTSCCLPVIYGSQTPGGPWAGGLLLRTAWPVEFAVLHTSGERGPFARSEDEYRTIRILTVPHADVAVGEHRNLH